MRITICLKLALGAGNQRHRQSRLAVHELTFSRVQLVPSCPVTALNGLREWADALQLCASGVSSDIMKGQREAFWSNEDTVKVTIVYAA
jgi:hypothetical protein